MGNGFPALSEHFGTDHEICETTKKYVLTIPLGAPDCTV